MKSSVMLQLWKEQQEHDMQEFIDRLQELCDEHDVDMPENIFDLNPYDFKYDRREAQELLQELYDAYYDACCVD